MSARSQRQNRLLLNLDQVECLSSAVRIQLYAAFRLLGPCTIARVAELMRRPADGLYHHVRKMAGVGLLVGTGTERVAKRDSAIYDVAAEFVFPTARPWSDEYIRALTGFRRSVFESSAKFGALPADPNVDLSLNMVSHLAVWLQPEIAREAVRRMIELEQWVLQNQDPANGAPFVLLSAVLPLASIEK